MIKKFNQTSTIKNQTSAFLKCLMLMMFLFTGVLLNAQYDANRYPIIPKPYQLLPFSGEFLIDSKTVILTDNRFYHKEIDFFRKQVKDVYGIDLKYGNKKVSGNFIYISEDSMDIPNEGYDLFVIKNEINIYGGHAGIFYALESLFQLIHPSTGSQFPIAPLNVPSCSIVDQPRFTWRGMHLDVARHFFLKEDVKNYLRYMAMYKLNTFHWHLTDDQGWRIEIKKYPKLTSIGAWRNGTLIGHEGETVPRFDTIKYGGFYTQDEIREIVKFADSLHITIVPEIEMPGHALAILAAYPELACTSGPFSVSQTWGGFDDVLCPSEKTFSFLEDVLKEVCALFPGKYIHIGGDECPKSRWKESVFCQDLMKKNNLKDENELQSWFTQRIVKMLQQRGKQAIGWDEILEGGLAEGAAIMSWRGEEGGIAAAKTKHNVVMSPGGFCYLDHYQSQNASEPLAIGGYLPLEKVYEYDPVPSSLNADEKKYILGVQANLWTEYIPSFTQVQYMIFPRMAAEAEVAWDETANKNFDFFVARLIPHFQLYDRMKINYSKSLFEVKPKIERGKDGNGILISLSTMTSNGKIHFTRGGKEITSESEIYSGPISIHGDETIIAAVYEGPQIKSSPYIQHFQKNLALGKSIALRKNPSTSYNTNGSLTLVDGIVGRKSPWLGSQWLGFSGDTLDATIDLGKDTLISNVNLSILNDPNSWIYAPYLLKVFVSNDGIQFNETKVSEHVPQKESLTELSTSFQREHARYVKVVCYPRPIIPIGHPGEGNPAWLFVSEIEVN